MPDSDRQALQADASMQSHRRVNITFGDETHLPILLANAMQILVSPTEFIVTLGVVTPPQVKTREDFDAIEKVTAQPLFRFAVSHQVFKDFIDVMSAQYDLVLQQQKAALVSNTGGDTDGE